MEFFEQTNNRNFIRHPGNVTHRNENTLGGQNRKICPRMFPMGANALKELLQKPPYIVARSLIADRSGYEILIEDDQIPPYKFDLVLQVLNVAVLCKTDREATLELLLKTFHKPQFLNQLNSYTSTLKYHLDKAKEFLPYIIKIIECFVQIAPVEASPKVSSLTDICFMVLMNLKSNFSGEYSVCETSLLSIQSQIQDIQTKWVNNQKRGNQRLEQLDSVSPPENFKTIKVVPSCEDLLQTEEPFLRRNIVDGAYVNSGHYLDVHFRLMREDFIRPLREGLQHHLSSSFEKNRDVRVYKNVFYCDSKVEDKGLVFYIELNLPKFFNPDKSKRLMFGNILCLSHNGFQSMIIASVCNRDKLKEKLLGIQFEGVEKNSRFLDLKKNYTMIESKAYFVAYMHTLKALQKLIKVPFENYIVKVEEHNSSPNYLQRFSTYNFSPLLKKSCEDLSVDGSQRQDLFSAIFNHQLLKESDVGEVCLLDGIRNWPSCEDLNLDESQRQALHSALTRQLAIIQGPPGTGKTYVGLQIVKLLLHNKNVWKNSVAEGKSPLLVVCYTNHALDQFLEGISHFTRSIIRVGSRSKNEALKSFQINNLIRRRNIDPNVQRALSSGFGATLSKLSEIKAVIGHISELLKKFQISGIIHKSVFINSNVIPPHLRKQFENLSLKEYLISGNANRGKKDAVDAAGLNKIADALLVGSRPENEKHSIDGLTLNDIQELKCEPNPNSEFYEEIFEEEQNARMLDDDWEDDIDCDSLLANSSFDNKLQNIHFEFLEVDHMQRLNLLQSQISQIDDLKFDREYLTYLTEIDILEKELKILRGGLAIIGSRDECFALKLVEDISPLSLPQRWMLYNSWKGILMDNIQREKRKFEEEYVKVAKNLNSLRNVEYLTVMKEVDIVGMTTTGAAQYCDILYDLAPPIVIVEEAAEILEAHVISSLSENCQQLILIGDHQQLQPNPSVYRLAVNYNLNVSMFERLIKNGIAYTRLEYQHRMKPCISELLVPTIYQELKDHPKVFRYPKIRGVEKDLFFLDHSELESKYVDDNDSVENAFEAEFVVALCRHLLFQGYASDDITILTPYSGQHRLIRERQRDYPHCSEVRVAILDNYQGEECNIIILSLVRSNEEGVVGFVKSDNRVCVALSRAKHGFYMTGNMTQFSKVCPLWSQLNQKLISSGSIGSQMTLVCGNHPSEIVQVSSGEEFILNSPEGGCKRSCNAPLPNCKHLCQRTCHVFDADHSSIDCKLPCSKLLCSLNHPCPKLCYQKCDSCKVLVEKVLPCLHSHKIPCSTKPEDYPCSTAVERELLGCKHMAKMKCYEKILDFKCKVNCDIRLDCGHQCQKACHVNKDPEHERYLCHANCDRNPENCKFNHACKKYCYEECGPCPELIKKNLVCGHTLMNIPCGTPLEQINCQKACKKTLPCGHPCPKICYEACGGCKVKVVKTIPGCLHLIKMECGIVPSAYTCTAMCNKILPCGHPCKKKCGEPCSINSCQELVSSKILCPRKHVIKLPCSTAITAIPKNTEEDEVYWELCKEKCSVKLQCEHTCEGECGKCYNGRFHLKCNSGCNKALVCGHVCKAPCSSTCPPCQSPCELKCDHSSCKKKCGIPCVDCKQLCTRSCPHKRCSKKCGSPCGWLGCDRPCAKKLPCGHACIGFCGEPCPHWCRICDKDEVETIFFGEEDNFDARFVLLEDCGHIFESNGILGWINSKSEEIGMKKCPLCSKPLYNTRRFHQFINEAFEDVKMVKSKFFTLKPNIYKKDFVPDLKRLMPFWRTEVGDLLDKLGYNKIDFQLKRRQPAISDHEYSLYSFQIDFLKNALEVRGKLDKNLLPKTNLENLIKRIFQLHISVSDQTREEAISELRRILTLISVQELKKNNAHERVRLIYESIKVIMDPTIPFSTETETRVVEYLKEAENYTGSLGISDAERKMIVAAMGFKQGHWYKCPNGHAYSIGECGGAMQEAKCPECNATIGGASHRLRADNRVATEMDGATRPAYGNY